MEYNDLVEHRISIRNRDRRYDNKYNQFEGSTQERYSTSLPGRQHFAVYILKRIWSNKRLRLYLILLTIVMLAIAVMIVIALIPLIARIFDFLTQDGIKGIVTGVTDYIGNLLNGFAK
jgi:hypothetical protein